MMEWQPIETAPKDDLARFLLCIPSIRLSPVQLGFWRKHDDRFGFFGSFGIKHERANQPTHWMPLPSPPQDS